MLKIIKAEKLYPRTFYVGFREGTHLFKKWLKKGFGHVWVIYPDEHFWVVIEPLNGMLVTKVKYDDLIEFGFQKELAQCNTVLEVKKDFYWPKTAKLLPRRMDCVGVTKYVLGLKNCWAWTPYQLYKWLLRQPNVTKL